jgi:hypothetical protein
MEVLDIVIGMILGSLLVGFALWLQAPHKAKRTAEESQSQTEPSVVEVPLRIPDILVVREKYIWPHGKFDLVIGEAGEVYWATQEIWAKLAPGRKYSIVSQHDGEDWSIVKIINEEKS